MIKIIKRIFERMSEAKKSAIVFMASNYIQYGISFFVTPLFARLLTTADFGLVSIFNSWVEIMGTIATLSLYQAFFNIGMFEYKDSRDLFSSSMLGLSTVSSVITMAAFVCIQLIWPNVIGLPKILTMLMAIYFIAYPATRYWIARERFEYRYKKLFWVTLISAFLTPTVGIICVLLTKDNRGVARLVGTNAVTILIGTIFYIYIYQKGRKLYDKDKWNAALKFSLPLIPHYLAMHVLAASDRVMISNMTGNTNAGIYGMAYTASMVITTAWTAINGSFTPYALEKLKNREFKNLSRVGTQCIILFSGLCLMVCIAAPEIILFLGGSKYVESIKLIPPLLAAVLFMEMYNLFSIVEFYHKKTRLIMIATVVSALMNVVLNYFFIKAFGYRAAAYTTLLCYILYCVFHYINMKYIEPERIYDAKILVGFSVIYVAACFGCLMIYDDPLVRYGILIAIVVSILIKRKKIIEFIRKL